MQDEIFKLEQEIQHLQPLSDEQIQQRLEAGEDAENVINQEQANATRLRVVSVQLAALRKKQREQAQANAQRDIARMRDDRDNVKDEARKALKQALDAVEDLEEALNAFDVHSKDAAEIGANMNRVAKLGGIREPLRDTELTSPLFSLLQDRCFDLLNKRRNTQFKEALTIDVE